MCEKCKLCVHYNVKFGTTACQSTSSVWRLRVNCVQAAKSIEHCQSETVSTICAHLIVFGWKWVKVNSFAVTTHRKFCAIKMARVCRKVTNVKVQILLFVLRMNKTSPEIVFRQAYIKMSSKATQNSRPSSVSHL